MLFVSLRPSNHDALTFKTNLAYVIAPIDRSRAFKGARRSEVNQRTAAWVIVAAALMSRSTFPAKFPNDALGRRHAL